MNKVVLILLKLNNCPYCIKFMPIFDRISQLIKNVNEFKDINFEIKIYDYNTELDKFKDEYKHLAFWATEAPKIFIDCIINGKDKQYKTIEPIFAEKENNEEYNKTAIKFLNVLVSGYKEILSLQKGGYDNIYYKNKYLKYKNKYLILKNNN